MALSALQRAALKEKEEKEKKKLQAENKTATTSNKTTSKTTSTLNKPTSALQRAAQKEQEAKAGSNKLPASSVKETPKISTSTRPIKQEDEDVGIWDAIRDTSFMPESWEDFGKGMAYNAERIGAGLLGFGEGITDFLGSTFYKGVEGVSSLGGLAPNKVSEWAGNASEKFLDNSITQDYEKSIRERYNPTAAEETLSGVGQSVADVLASIATGKGAAKLVGKGIGIVDDMAEAAKAANWGKAAFGTRAAGSSATEAYDEGANTNQALLYGAGSGLTEVILESLSGGIPGFGNGVVTQAIQKVVSNPVVNKILDIAGEGGEEAASTIISPFLKRAIYDSDAALATADEIAESAIMGTITAGILQGGIELPSYISARTQYNNQATQQDDDVVRSIIEEGLATDPTSKSYKQAEKLNAKLDAGQTITNKDLNSLYRQNVKNVDMQADPDAALAEAAAEAVARETSVEAPQGAQESVSSADVKVPSGAENVTQAQAGGQSVPYNVMSVNNQARKAFTNPGYGEVGTRTFAEIVEESGQSADQVRTQFQTAYELGKLEAPREKVSFESAVQESAYNAGRQDAILSMKKAEIKGATVWGKEGGLIQNEYSAKLDTRTTDTLQKIGKATGTKIIVEAIPAELNANGYYKDSDGTIHIDSNTTQPVMTVVKHELTHRMQSLAPKEYTQFRNYAVQAMSLYEHGNLTAVERMQHDYARRSDGRVQLSVEDAMDEIAANFTERILTDEKALNDFVNQVTKSEEHRTMGQKFFQAVREFIDKVKSIFKGDKAKMDQAARDEFGATIDQLEKAEQLWKEAYQAATKKAANETGRAGETRDTMSYSLKEGSKRGKAKDENRRAFLERSRRGARKSGEAGDAVYAYTPASWDETNTKARQVQEELTLLGIESFFHAGLEVNENGKTLTAGDVASAISDKVVGIYYRVFGDPKEVAGHEAYHIWTNAPERSEYTKIFRESMIGFFESAYALQQALEVESLYFTGAKIDKAEFFEEYIARLSGQIHSGEHEADLRTAFKDYDAVKAAWQTLVKSQAKDYQFSLKEGRKHLTEAEELSDLLTKFSLREKEPPKKVGIAYKVFYAKDGQLYPPMVANPGGKGTPVGVWLDADVAASAAPSKTGRPQVQAGGKGTNAGKMSLAFRPGWHLGDLPMAAQFARKNPETGAKDLFPADFVWAECEYAMDHDYQEEAMSYGYTENGKFRHSYAGLPRLPEDGYYRYRTNPNPDTVPWVITGAMRVKRILTDAETDKILRDAGVEPMKRQGGKLDLEKLGLKAGAQFSLKDKEYVPTFYSQMERVVEGVKQEKLGASSVVSMLRGKGVKAEEIKWSGIETFLEGKKSVTKQELLEFMRANRLEVQEEAIEDEGDGTLPYTDAERTQLDRFSEQQDDLLERASNLWMEAYGEDIPFEIYGADEIGVAISRAVIDHNGGMRNFVGMDQITETERALERVGYEMHQLDLRQADLVERVQARQKNTSNTYWSQYKLDGGKNYREYLFNMPGSNYINDSMEAHWKGRTGVLAHARVQDFDTSDGKALFIEEIQSDWHNEGRKMGYYAEDAAAKLEEQKDLVVTQKVEMYRQLLWDLEDYYRSYGVDTPREAAERHLDMFYDSDILKAFNSAYDYPVDLRERLDRYFDLDRQEDALDMQLRKARRGIPDAPFHNNYHEFVLKSLLRKAAEGGYSYLAWTPGWMQEKRWSSDYAEGYRIEYDQDIPKFLNKYGKQWGAAVSKMHLNNASDEWYREYGEGEIRQNEELRAEWEVMLEDPNRTDRDFIQSQIDHYNREIETIKRHGEVWAIPITDAMKQSVLYEGQAQFSLKDSTGKELTKEQAEYFKDSKVRDKNGNLLVVYHGGMVENTFDTDLGGDGSTQYGKGAYFTTGEYYASEYSSMKGGQVKPYYLNIAKMFDDSQYNGGEIADSHEWSNLVSILKDKGLNERQIKGIKEYGFDRLKNLLAQKDGGAGGFFGQSQLANDVLRQAGYDGIRADLYDSFQYVIFTPEQVKSIDNKKPTDDPDIRFSMKDQSDVMRDNAKLKAVNAALKEQLKTTKFAKVDQKELRKFARNLLKDYTSDADLDVTLGKLDSLYTFLANDDPAAVAATQDQAMESLENSWDEFSQPSKWSTAYRMAYNIAEDVIRGASELNDDMYVEFEDVRNYLRTTGISMNKFYEQDLAGYENLNDFRKRNFGRIKITKDGLDVSKAYQELANRYPVLFNESEHSHPGDQLVHLAEVLDSMAPIEENPFSYNMREATSWLANDIMERFFELPQAKPTFADKAQRKLTEQKIKDAKKLERVRNEGRERVANIIAEYREKVKETRKQEKEAKWEAVAKVKDHYKAKEAKMSESRKAAVLRDRISRHVGELKQRLLRPTDKKHIPQELQGAVAKLLESINQESRYEYAIGEDGKLHRVERGSVEGAEPTKRTQAFAELQSVYAQLSNELTIDPDLMGDDGLLNDVIKLSDKPLATMTSEELRIVWDTIRAVEWTVRTANKMHAAGRWATVSEAAEALREDNQHKDEKTELRGILGKGQKLTGLDMETPETYFHMLGKSGDNIFRSMRNAQDEHIRLMKNVADFTHKSLNNVDVPKLENELHSVILGGETVKLSTAQIMELYVLSKRKQAIDHIFVGGILPDVVSAKGLKKITKASPVRGVTPAEVGKVVSILTEEQRKIADQLQEYASTELSKWGNQASMKVYGYEKFGEKNYWPIRVNRQEIKSDVQKDTAVTSLANRSFTKGTKPHANNSLRLGSIFDTFSTHSSEMATYAAWLGTLEDVNRIRNFTFRDEATGHAVDTVKSIIDTVHGTSGNAYLDKLLADVTNGVKGTHGETAYMSSLVGNFKAAAVGANLRVIIQQPTAILRAADMIDPKHMATTGNPLSGWNKAKKYAPIAQWKDWGYFDINTGRQMKDVLFDSDTVLDKAKSISMWGAGAMDSVAWGHLWNAVEAETKAERKTLRPGTESFYEAVAERFTEIVDHTQVVDGILQRSQIMRSADGVTKMATAFMGEPTKQYNMLMQAAYDAKHVNGDKRKAAMKHLARAATVLAISGIANSMAQAIIDAVRDDDKEEEYWEKLLASFKENLGSTFNPVAYVPFAKDVLSILQGYDVSRMDMESIEKVVSAGQNMMKALSGEGKHTVGGAAINLIAEVARLVGLPVSNLKREITTFSMLAAVEADNYLMQYRMEKWLLNMNNNGSAFVGILYNAYVNDKAAYKIIYDDMVKSGYDPEKIKSAMETRMKKDQGVTKVEDMEQRYMSPKQQAEFDSKMKPIKGDSLWKSATADQRDNLEDRLYNLVSGTGKAQQMSEELKEMSPYGIDETEYLLYKLALEMYDTPNKSGELGGTPTNAEKASAIQAMGNLSDGEIAALWDTDKGYEAYASGVDMSAYIDYLGDGGTVSLDKMIEAQDYGISTTKYIDFLDMLDKYDQPTESGNYGTFTQDEASAAIAAMTGLTREQKAHLWQSVNKGWNAKNNPWK